MIQAGEWSTRPKFSTKVFSSAAPTPCTILQIFQIIKVGPLRSFAQFHCDETGFTALISMDSKPFPCPACNAAVRICEPGNGTKRRYGKPVEKYLFFDVILISIITSIPAGLGQVSQSSNHRNSNGVSGVSDEMFPRQEKPNQELPFFEMFTTTLSNLVSIPSA